MRLVLPIIVMTALGARAEVPHAIQISQGQLEALTPIDTLPNTSHLDHVFQNDTLENLASIALTTDLIDLGVQLRAIRTLAAFCPKAALPEDPPPPCGVGTITHDTLAQLVDGYNTGGTPTPRDVLKLRAAIEALGISARSAGLDADVDRLVEFLDHPSRDIRAATAKALGTLCNTQAIQPLRIRLQIESNPANPVGRPQVRLAISAALRDLGGGQCAPP